MKLIYFDMPTKNFLNILKSFLKRDKTYIELVEGNL